MGISNINTCKYFKDSFGSQKNIKVTTTDSKELWVPMDAENTDYIDVLAWVDAGNTIEEVD